MNDDLVLASCTVVDGTGADPAPGVAVWSRGERIEAVGRDGKVKAPAGAEIVEAKGKVLLPGLWDMHVHVLRPDRVEQFLPLLIANGVTGVRDMGTTAEGFSVLGALRSGIAAGKRIGPSQSP